jgi:DNA-directed RNA polymerase specialized sigma24 family protein
MPTTNDKEEPIEALAIRACSGDEPAWQDLWRRVELPLGAMVRQFHMGRISHEDDERRAVVLEVMARLRADEFRRLKMFNEARTRDPKLSLLPWLKVVAKRVAIDRLRAHPHYVGGDRVADGARAPGVWNDPQSLPPPSRLPGAPPAVTRDNTAREILEHAREVLPAMHYRALELKLQGDDAAAIARTLGLPAGAEADRIVRAAFERLRRRFRADGSEESS